MNKIFYFISAILAFSFPSLGQEERQNKKTDHLEEHSIINLFDAFGRRDDLIKEFGFSCILKYNGTTISSLDRLARDGIMSSCDNVI